MSCEITQGFKRTWLSFTSERSCYYCSYWPNVCSWLRSIIPYNNWRNGFTWIKPLERWSSTLSPDKDAASHQMCSHRATTKFGTKFQDNDGQVGLYSRLWLCPPYWFQQNKNGWACWRIWNNWTGVVDIFFHLCRSRGASGEKVAGKGETCPLNSSLWKEFSGLERAEQPPPVFVCHEEINKRCVGWIASKSQDNSKTNQPGERMTSSSGW